VCAMLRLGCAMITGNRKVVPWPAALRGLPMGAPRRGARVKNGAVLYFRVTGLLSFALKKAHRKVRRQLTELMAGISEREGMHRGESFSRYS
jgi:hypothetical protein